MADRPTYADTAATIQRQLNDPRSLPLRPNRAWIVPFHRLVAPRQRLLGPKWHVISAGQRDAPRGHRYEGAVIEAPEVISQELGPSGLDAFKVLLMSRMTPDAPVLHIPVLGF